MFSDNEVPEILCDQQRLCEEAFNSKDSHAILALLPKLQGHDDIVCSVSCSITDRESCLVHCAAVRGWTDVIEELISVYKCNPAKRDSRGWTALHWAARIGHLDAVKHLVEGCGCDVNDRTDNGSTPLHRAAWEGRLNVAQYLVEHGAIPIATDEFGATPLHFACWYNYENRNVPVIKYLVSKPDVLNYFKKCNSILLNNENIIDEFEYVQISHPVVNIFLLGDSRAGKTSLCHVIKERSEDYIKAGELVKGVKAYTAGIIPNFVKFDRDLGSIIIHDIAGQPEYYSSHTAVFESLLQKSGAIFVIVINLAEDQLKQVGFWSNFVKNESQKLSSNFHLIVIASHADKFDEQALKRERFKLKGFIKRELADLHVGDDSISTFSLDCRQLSKTTHTFIESLKDKCILIRNEQSQVISLYCNFLHSILETRVSKDVGKCTLKELKPLCHQSQQEGIPLPNDIVPLLKTLHSNGIIIYLEDEENLENSWIIIRQEILLDEVNGVLFAPEDFDEHKEIASNTGIITSSALHELFPRHSSNMLISFLKLMKLCEEIDEALLKVTNLELRKKDSPCVSNRLLFCPALIALSKPQELIKKSFTIGWCLKVTGENAFSMRFLHVLLLKLAYRYSIAASSKNRPWVEVGLERQCDVWTNGIHWYNKNGVEAMVEYTQGKQCVNALLSCLDGKDEEMVELHFELRKIITELQRHYCPTLECKDYLYSSCELHCSTDTDSISDLTKYDMDMLIYQIDTNEKRIPNTDTVKEPSEIAKLLPIEPKRYLSIYYKVTEENVHDTSGNNKCGAEAGRGSGGVSIASSVPPANVSTVISGIVEHRDHTAAYNVLKNNQFKICSSQVDVFLLATSLSGNDAISDELHQKTIDHLTGLSTTERVVQLISSVIGAVKDNGEEFFDKLLHSLRECGQEQLADELYHCYILECSTTCTSNVHSSTDTYMEATVASSTSLSYELKSRSTKRPHSQVDNETICKKYKLS